MVDAVCLGAVNGCHLNRCHRLHASFHCQTHNIIKMSFAQNVRRCDIIRTEAYTAGKRRIYLRNRTDIFFQEMCHTRLTDQHMHPLTHLLYNLFMVIALMVKTHARAQIAIQVVPSRHRSTSKYRKAVLKCFRDGAKRIFILFLDKFTHCLPYAKTLWPFLYLGMYFFIEVKCNRRLGNRIRRLVRRAPKNLERTFFHLVHHLTQPFQPGNRNILIKSGNHAGRPVRHDSLRIAGNAELAAFAVDMPVNHARHQIPAARIDNLRFRPDIRLHIADSRNHIIVNCHIRRINLA